MFANRRIRGVRVPCVAFLIVAVILIIVYGAILRKTNTKDILEKKLVDHECLPGFDGWWLTHFLFFGLLGVLYPNHYVQVLIAGLGWEGIEHALGTNQFKISGKRLQLIGDQDEEGRPTGKQDSWWYSRPLTDSYANISGYVLGSAFANRFWPNKDE